MKLYIGNLPHDATGEAELTELLADYGPLEHIHIPVDRETGRTRGFAFVTFASKEAAQSALAELDGQDFGGRTLRLSEARENPDRKPRQGGGNDRSRQHNSSQKPGNVDRQPRNPKKAKKNEHQAPPSYNDWDDEERGNSGGGGKGKGGKSKGSRKNNRRRSSGNDDWGW
ncbi:MAG: RNA recognition motif domain-containing protein [Verrucomicrobiales bacterium]